MRLCAADKADKVTLWHERDVWESIQGRMTTLWVCVLVDTKRREIDLIAASKHAREKTVLNLRPRDAVYRCNVDNFECAA